MEREDVPVFHCDVLDITPLRNVVMCERVLYRYMYSRLYTWICGSERGDGCRIHCSAGRESVDDGGAENEIRESIVNDLNGLEGSIDMPVPQSI